MALDQEQIEIVREIILSTSYSETAVLVAALNPAQETMTIADIAAWTSIRNKFTRVTQVGSIKMLADKSDNRLGITNRVRRRLGLSAIDSESDLNVTTEICVSTPVMNNGDCGCV